MDYKDEMRKLIDIVKQQSFTSKDISDIRNDYLQKQSELQPIKPQSPF